MNSYADMKSAKIQVNKCNASEPGLNISTVWECVQEVGDSNPMVCV